MTPRGSTSTDRAEWAEEAWARFVRGYAKQWRINWPLLLAFLIIVVIFVVLLIFAARAGSVIRRKEMSRENDGRGPDDST